jgi:ubiquinone biosynthesis protein
MDLLDGVSLSQPAALDAAGIDRRQLAGTVIAANLTMILSSGPFHADPHPGNFLALPGGRIGLVDFGATGTADPATRATLAGLLSALAAGDAHRLAEGIVAITTPAGPVDLDRLTAEVRDLLVPLTASALQTLPLGRVLRQLLGLLRRHHLHVSPQLAPLIKAIIECESTAQELHPQARLTDVLTPFLTGQLANEQSRSPVATGAA